MYLVPPTISVTRFLPEIRQCAFSFGGVGWGGVGWGGVGWGGVGWETDGLGSNMSLIALCSALQIQSSNVDM